MGNKDKRNLILKAALRIISEKGYSATTLDEITQKAGVGKGTFYLYFKDKADMFYSIMKEELDNIMQEIMSVVEEIDDFFEKIKKGIEIYLAYHQKHPFFFKVMIQEKPFYKGKNFYNYWEDFFSRWGIINEGISQQIQAGTIKEMDHEDMIYSLLGMMHAHIHRWILSGRKYSLVDKADTIYQIFVNGIRR